MNETATNILIGVGIVAAVLIFFAWLRTLMQICPPNQVIVVSGRRTKMADGRTRGFKTVFAGLAWRLPVIHKVDRMSLNIMEVPISIRGAYSKGGIALNVEAIANVKISSDEQVVGNAIERFLGRDPNEIRRVAKETLEGHLRGVLARLTPEQVNEDRLKFAEELASESELDLSKLGIHLDTLKIQHVSDEVQYLDSIGRGAIATVIKEAQIAESDAKRQAELAEAENQARANVAKANAESNISRMRNDLRRIQAELESEVRSEEERTLAAAKEARANAEHELQGIRADLEVIRLRVEQVIPAEAEQEAQGFRAKGAAAPIRERGVAAAEALDLMTSAWADAGDTALSLYLMEDIEKILAIASQGVAKIKIDNLNIIDGGDGATLAGYIGAYPGMLDAIFSSVEKTTGINIQSAISGISIPKDETSK